MGEDLFYKLLILRSKGIGAVKYHELVRASGGAEAAVESLAVSGELMDTVRREMDLAARLGVQYLTDDMPGFPAVYKSAKNHSPILSVLGDVKTLSKKTVAMVGTRHATAHGLRFISDLAQEFAAHEYAVVSGMAMGTDTAAHAGALRGAESSATVAVLAGGVDYVWPKENERLYHEIIANGCIVSDMPVGFTPVAANFIARNRIVAGLSEMLILGEADEKSGSVATARFTLELGRSLWAIPSHPSDARSAGPNRFISDGDAKLCSGASDFFIRANETAKKTSAKNLSSPLLDLIGSEPTSESVLTSLAEKNISETMAELTVLELGGLVKKVDGGYVRV